MKCFVIIFIYFLLTGCNNDNKNLTIYNNRTNKNKSTVNIQNYNINDKSTIDYQNYNNNNESITNNNFSNNNINKESNIIDETISNQGKYKILEKKNNRESYSNRNKEMIDKLVKYNSNVKIKQNSPLYEYRRNRIDNSYEGDGLISDMKEKYEHIYTYDTGTYTNNNNNFQQIHNKYTKQENNSE